MDEKTMNITEETASAETVETTTTPVTENTAPVEENPAPVTEETETEEDETEETEAETEAESDKDDKDAYEEPSKPFPKKDLGMGGASFCDMLYKTSPDWILAMVKRGEKTFAGCWNWVYSYMEDRYIKQNGRVSGGVFADVQPLVEKYFREIPEGTVVAKPKTKPAKKQPKNDAKKVVEKVAKKAASDAKKEAKKEIEQTDLFADLFN